MRSFLAAALVIASSSVAVADSTKRPCNVEVLRAPDDVRSSIAAWLGAESSCAVSLVVRAVKTDGGYYLLAHAPDGRIFETIVADAELAAEAVTRWATNRTSPLAPIAPPAPTSAPVPHARPAPMTGSPASTGIDPVPPTPIRVDGGGQMPVRDDARWFAAGAILGEDLYGLRGEVDLWTKQRWSVGAALELSTMDMAASNPPQSYDLSFEDIRVMAKGARTWGGERVQIRAQVAVGLSHSRVTGRTQITNSDIDASDYFATGDATVQLVVHVTPAWAVAAGPQFTAYSHEFRRTSDDMTLVRRDYAVSAFAALRRRM